MMSVFFRILDEFKKSNLVIRDYQKLQYYITFCLDRNQNKRIKGKTSLHHILPQAKSCFPEFKDLKAHSWNGTHLRYSDHYIAHAMFCDAVFNDSQLSAWYAMNNKDIRTKKINSPEELIGPELHQKLMEERSFLASKNRKNNINVTVVSTGESRVITTEEFYKNKELYRHHAEGIVSCIDKTTKSRIKVTSEEYHNNENYISNTEGKITATLIETGEKVNVTSEEYKENKHLYKTHRTKMLNVVLIETGETIFISSEEYNQNKELYFYSFAPRNMVSAKNTLTGEVVKVTKEIFVNSDYLVGLNSGREPSRRVYSLIGGERSIKLSELDDFLKNNTDFKLGRAPKKEINKN